MSRSKRVELNKYFGRKLTFVLLVIIDFHHVTANSIQKLLNVHKILHLYLLFKIT